MSDFDPCSRAESSSGLRAFCSDSPANNTEFCKKIDTFILCLKADCYITRVFFPLTGILIVIGTILNLFCLYCFLKTTKRNSQNVYLSVLSLVDTINLHINFTLPMLRRYEIFDYYFRKYEIFCRLTGVLTEFFLIFPTWIVVLLTFERLIFILRPLKRRPSYTQIRAKIYITILAFIIVLLSLYRLIDLKGIDQVSVFSVVACNGTKTIAFMRNLNLIIWTILPECLTLIMSLIIIYQIKLATQHFESHPSTARQLQYNQATKIVLLISILFLIFHTPTGIMIALNIYYANSKQTLGIIIILVSKKITILLYQISLCCKFFIYHRTFQNFKILIHQPITRLIHRANSAKLGQSILKNPHDCPQHQIIHFGLPKRSMISAGSQNDSVTKSAEEHHDTFHNRHQRTSSTSVPRTNREYQPLTAVMNKTNEEAYVALSRTPDLLRYAREKRRSLWSIKPQITL